MKTVQVHIPELAFWVSALLCTDLAVAGEISFCLGQKRLGTVLLVKCRTFRCGTLRITRMRSLIVDASCGIVKQTGTIVFQRWISTLVWETNHQVV